MCGIVGAVSTRNIVPVLVEGLKRLEYRGYDSCGVAVHQHGGLRRTRSTSRVAELSTQIAQDDVQGGTGIAHTRWATHGVPAVHNAHPHFSGDRIALASQFLRLGAKCSGQRDGQQRQLQVGYVHANSSGGVVPPRPGMKAGRRPAPMAVAAPCGAAGVSGCGGALRPGQPAPRPPGPGLPARVQGSVRPHCRSSGCRPWRRRCFPAAMRR